MSYNPVTDFLGLLRLTGGGVRSERMPGLDFMIAALARTGFITLFVGSAPPTMNQASTVWLQPASPSWDAEGVVFIWNSLTNEYEVATPTLWARLVAGVFPSTTLPLVDGIAAIGALLTYARADHRHPTDTSRAPLDSPFFTGVVRAPTPPPGESDNSIATTAFVTGAIGATPPIGSVIPYAGAASPSASFMLCQGQAISRTTYSVLFAAAGITFGAGDGVNTFNIPDLRGRVVAGVDGGVNRLTTATMSSQALGGFGGVETITLTAAQLAAHTHPNTLTDPMHQHSLPNSLVNFSGGTGIQSGGAYSQGSSATNSAATGITITNAANTGGGNPHNNVQPTLELSYLIRVL